MGEYILKAWRFLITKSKPVLVLIIIGVVLLSYFYIPFAWKNKIDTDATTQKITFEAKILVQQDSLFHLYLKMDKQREEDKKDIKNELKNLILNSNKGIVKMIGDQLVFLISWREENKKLLIEHVNSINETYESTNSIDLTQDTTTKPNIKIKIIKK